MAHLRAISSGHRNLSQGYPNIDGKYQYAEFCHKLHTSKWAVELPSLFRLFFATFCKAGCFTDSVSQVEQFGASHDTVSFYDKACDFW